MPNRPGWETKGLINVAKSTPPPPPTSHGASPGPAMSETNIHGRTARLLPPTGRQRLYNTTEEAMEERDGQGQRRKADKTKRPECEQQTELATARGRAQKHNLLQPHLRQPCTQHQHRRPTPGTESKSERPSKETPTMAPAVRAHQPETTTKRRSGDPPFPHYIRVLPPPPPAHRSAWRKVLSLEGGAALTSPIFVCTRTPSCLLCKLGTRGSPSRRRKCLRHQGWPT